MFRSDARIIESGRNGMRFQHLSFRRLQQITARAVQNPGLPFLERCGVAMRVETGSRRFDTVNTDSGAVLSKLTHGLSGGDILLLHDGHAARGKSGNPVILDVLPKLLQAVSTAGLRPITLRGALLATSDR